jgi:hypothetical protein
MGKHERMNRKIEKLLKKMDEERINMNGTNIYKSLEHVAKFWGRDVLAEYVRHFYGKK